jgi:hypothetical protein
MESIGYLVVEFEVHKSSLMLRLDLAILERLGRRCFKLTRFLNHLLSYYFEASLVSINHLQNIVFKCIFVTDEREEVFFI